MIGSMVMMVCLGGVPAHAFTGAGGADTAVRYPETADTAVPTDPSTPAPTADTGQVTGGTTPTNGTTTYGTTTYGTTTTEVELCYDCIAASDLAGDEGGSPCGDCTTGSASPWLGLIALFGLVRRRRS